MSSTFRYGAEELKIFLPVSTFRGFVGSFGLLVLGCIGYSAFLLAQRLAPIKTPTIAATKLMHLPPPSTPVMPAVEPPSMLIAEGLAARAGTPVPVPDMLVSADETGFANIDEISRASVDGGNGVEDGLMSLITDSTEVREEELEVLDAMQVSRLPVVDIRDLQRKIVYPEMAKRMGIQGAVVVSVLIAKDGRPKKYIIERSDSELLNDAASKAVMEGIYVPAILENRPVECWVSIPIYFRLR